MKIEVEARLLECDVEAMIKKLEENNAKFVGDWLQIRHCYDFNPVNPNSWIRLRTNGKETTLTIKEIQDGSITGTKEWEVEVSDFAVADEMLNKMGYKARSIQENRRIRYMLNGVEVDIDFWPMIPTYVELEANSEDEIKEVCEKLGVDYNKLVTLDVDSIYKYYGVDYKSSTELKLEEERKPVVQNNEKEL